MNSEASTDHAPKRPAGETSAPARIGPADITGIVLAGGRGSRMGGADKGLQCFDGLPLARIALERLRPQVGVLMLNANRNLAAYQAFGAPVFPDADADHPGPLAGFLAGLEHCRSPYLLAVPCDVPGFPTDLAGRLADALAAEDADIAMAASLEDGASVAQPVFCLLRATLRDSLQQHMAQGGRRARHWIAQHRHVQVLFDRPGDAPDAFRNVNTLAELQALESTKAAR